MTRNIVVGGSGKSTFSRMLSSELKYTYLEMDAKLARVFRRRVLCYN
ncbi:hypothetical protein LAZ52_03135 [Vibrio alginolyticus]|nr:hypothetical protein [Vibrio alginolyticus]MCA2460323.1 hypothetical protein [Vibrio alginolyticus]